MRVVLRTQSCIVILVCSPSVHFYEVFSKTAFEAYTRLLVIADVVIIIIIIIITQLMTQ